VLPATVSAPAAEPPASILAAYAAHRARSGRGNILCYRAARSFLRRWPDVQAWASLPLPLRLAAYHNTRPFVTFLMVSRRLRPGWDYLMARKLSSFWRDLDGSALQLDLDRFMAAARGLIHPAGGLGGCLADHRQAADPGRPRPAGAGRTRPDGPGGCVPGPQAATGRGTTGQRCTPPGRCCSICGPGQPGATVPGHAAV